MRTFDKSVETYFGTVVQQISAVWKAPEIIQAICNFNHARKFSKSSRELCHAAVLVRYPRYCVAIVQFPAKLITVVV
jgi:hypothetical protein